MSIKDIKQRVEIGYTQSVYGSTEAIHAQMLEDIKYLLNIDKIEELKRAIEEYALETNQTYLQTVEDIRCYNQWKNKV